MKRRIPLLLLLLLPALAAPPSLQSIVQKKDFRAAHKLAERVAKVAGRTLDADLPPTSSVGEGEKLAYKLVVTDQTLDVHSLDGCVVLTTSSIKTGASMTNSLVISTSDIKVGSYAMNCTILSKGNLKIGSYSSGNNIEASTVRVGSDSTRSTYYGVTPRVGKPSRSDTISPIPELSRAISF